MQQVLDRWAQCRGGAAPLCESVAWRRPALRASTGTGCSGDRSSTPPTTAYRMPMPANRRRRVRDSPTPDRKLAVARSSANPCQCVSGTSALHGSRGIGGLATVCRCSDNEATPNRVYGESRRRWLRALRCPGHVLRASLPRRESQVQRIRLFPLQASTRDDFAACRQWCDGGWNVAGRSCCVPCGVPKRAWPY